MERALEARFSDLVNHPKDTVAKINASRSRHLWLRRRDDEDLVLTTAARAEQENEVVSATTALFTAMMRQDGAALSLLIDVVPEAFPWVRFLPTEDVRAFVVELVETLRATEAIDNPAPVAQVIESWKHTAEAYADPEVHASLTTDATDHGPATEPPSNV
ncbi:hypothetical protein SAMN04487905_101276 [Actinopolyspora xinjiangensis]|uniref:Prevent-host-death family protein n=1 Tax=Actinopolyspora xinjiangensis TaxID=405564 RepID=A0A1H0NVK7_9ACTN|nr:hypothetical protein [Actinopolyspora xinjiangensis]SDO96689.1 hypothetical protein SAMN04487905_101276 [Actinopolyspora xinjiangensis]